MRNGALLAAGVCKPGLAGNGSEPQPSGSLPGMSRAMEKDRTGYLRCGSRLGIDKGGPLLSLA